MTRARLAVVSAAAALALGFALGPARAGSANKAFDVTAKVVNSCTISVPTSIAFGDYDPVVTNKTAHVNVDTQQLSVTCTKNSPGVSVGLNAGGNAGGASVGSRAMTDGTDKLGYELFTDSGYSTVWADSGSAGTATFTAAEFATSTTSVARTIYARLFGGQANVRVGDYTDTVTATVYF